MREHTTRPKRRRLRVGPLLCVFALLAGTAACGDDDSADTAGETPADETPETSSDVADSEPLRVGVLVNITGQVLSGEQNVPPVLEAWADSVNSEGGIAGHPVEFVIEDTKGDAPTATAAAARLVDEDVVAVVSVDAFAEGVYAQSVADAGIPVIGGAGFDPTVWGGLPNVLPVMTTFPSWANAPMVLADSLGDERVGVGVCAEVATCEGIAATAQTAAEALGLSYAGTVRVAAAAPDFTAECLQLVNDNVDFLWVGHAAAVSLRFIESCATQGFTGHWVMAGGAAEPEVFLANDPSVKIDLVLFSFPWWVDDEPVAAYRELMEEQGVPETNWATQQSTAVYATMELFRTALDSNAATLPESPTAPDIIDAYATLDGETLDGLLPQPISFTPGQPQAQVTCYWYAQFEDGEFTGADLSEPVCDPSELG